MKSMRTDSSSISGYKLAGPIGNGRAKTRFIGSEGSETGQRDVMRVILLLTIIAGSCLLIYQCMEKHLQVMCPQWKTNWYSQNQTSFKRIEQPKPASSELERVLMSAAMEDNTVIITVLNNAWTAPNSTFDLFLESFQTGLGTERLLKHMIAVCFDSKAYDRCMQVQIHCYLINDTHHSEELSGINQFMSPSYLKLIWRQMDILKEVLSLGYNFLFTDADILWFRDPFPRFFSNVDFQISYDGYNGKPFDKNNYVNAGFIYVKPNNKTISFYEYWCDSRKRFPKRHDQNVFNSIKNEPFVAELGITMRFLDTVYFSGFCQPSQDINVVNTMHANCCIGFENKVKNIRAALEDWKQYLLVNTTVTKTQWNIPPRCGY